MSQSSAYDLLAPVFARADLHPDRRALVTMDESVTYAQLRDVVRSFALHMRANGMDRGARVAITFGHPLVDTLVAMACALIGCSWVRGFNHALTSPALRLTHALHAGPRPDGLRIRTLAVSPAWSRPPPGVRDEPFPCHRDAQAPWMIAQSSGTTGEPKYMALEVGSIRQRNLGNVCAAGPDGLVLLSLFPALSSLNLVPALQLLERGGTFVFGDLGEMFGRVGIDTVLGSPSHLAAFMDATPPGAGRLATCVVTGAPARPAFFGRLALYFERMRFIYGSTETSAATINDVPPTAGDGAGSIDLGPPIAGVEIAITDAAGAALPALGEGRVRVRAAGQAKGYIGEPALSAEVFRDGWFHPGDLGFLDERGHLHVTGRVNDLLNIGGAKMNPGAVDDVIQSLREVRDGVCFALPDAGGVDRLAAAVVTVGQRDPALLALSLAKAARDRVPLDQFPAVLFVLPEIPRNANGKVIRRALPDAVRGLAGQPVPAV